MKTSFSGDSDIIVCPYCENTLGVLQGDFLVVRRRGRTVKVTVWEEAEITCEECGTQMQVKRHRDGPENMWNGMLDSRIK